MLLPTLGERLRYARLLGPKLSARELDRLAGRPANSCRQTETRCQSTANPSFALAYAQALGVEAAWLLMGTGPRPARAAVVAAVEAARRRYERQQRMAERKAAA